MDDTSGLFTELVGDEDLIRPNYEIEVIEKAEDDTPDPLAEIEAEFRKQRQKDQRSKDKSRRKKKSDDSDETDEERSESHDMDCLLYTSPSPRDATLSRMPSSA